MNKQEPSSPSRLETYCKNNKATPYLLKLSQVPVAEFLKLQRAHQEASEKEAARAEEVKKRSRRFKELKKTFLCDNMDPRLVIKKPGISIPKPPRFKFSMSKAGGTSATANESAFNSSVGSPKQMSGPTPERQLEDEFVFQMRSREQSRRKITKIPETRESKVPSFFIRKRTTLRFSNADLSGDNVFSEAEMKA